MKPLSWRNIHLSFLDVISSFSFDLPQVGQGAMTKFALMNITEQVFPANMEETKFLLALKARTDEVISNVVLHSYDMEELQSISKKVTTLINLR